MDDCSRMVKETIKAFGGIDVIIGNAVSLFAGSKYIHARNYEYGRGYSTRDDIFINACTNDKKGYPTDYTTGMDTVRPIWRSP